MNARPVILAVSLAAALLPGARAQVALPPVQVPSLPRTQLPVDLKGTVGRVTDTVDPRSLRKVRLERVRKLLRDHRASLEADPQGAPIRRSEVLALSPAPAALAAARAAGFTVIRESTLDGLDARIVVLRAPAGVSTRRALEQLRAANPAGTYDFNHIYLESAATDGHAPARTASTTPASAATTPASAAAAQPHDSAGPTPSGVRVGLIDAGVDTTHPALRAAATQLHGCNGRRVASAHGTAVASLLVGQTEIFRGAAPGATLFAADVYCGEPTGGAVDSVSAALAWMAREHVAVVNISLVGPRNAMLESVTRALLARGHLLVAAVGNDGPAAKPLYPAAFPGVIGVTAVDARRRVLLEAGRGPQVDFAAPGADMAAARPGNEFATVRGTSYAAPLVAGLLAARLAEPSAANAASAAADLTATAEDLGPRGRDDAYGAGLVGVELRVAPGAAKPGK